MFSILTGDDEKFDHHFFSVMAVGQPLSQVLLLLVVWPRLDGAWVLSGSQKHSAQVVLDVIQRSLDQISFKHV